MKEVSDINFNASALGSLETIAAGFYIGINTAAIKSSSEIKLEVIKSSTVEGTVTKTERRAMSPYLQDFRLSNSKVQGG
ncbi:hypothetical protein CIB48_g5147 [Xylaria polymorpha]|nr:hypothetical protein CIB48_g5147 [Xylaria polymorpha]